MILKEKKLQPMLKIIFSNNLYLTGQFSAEGGQPSVILGGMLTAGSVIARDPYAADIFNFFCGWIRLHNKNKVSFIRDYLCEY